MKTIKWTAIGLLAGLAGVSQADAPVVAPQVGFSVTQRFGGPQAAPAEFGLKFHYGEVTANIYNQYDQRYRPALVDLRFTREGFTALNVSGVNALLPQPVLRQSEEAGGGFLSGINWGLVGLAVLAGGLYAASSDDYDDDDEAYQGGGGGNGGLGGYGGAGGMGGLPPAPELPGMGGTGGSGGSGGMLCAPDSAPAIGGMCSPVDPTAMGGMGGAGGSNLPY